MKKRTLKVALWAAVATLLPLCSHAQGVADSIHGLQGVLDNLYDQMIPLCSRMIDVGRGIAGFAAMWYIALRVWRHIAAAEPVDFYPLLRPFVIGFCILIFPMVLTFINGVLKPTVTATAAMVGNSNRAIEVMLDPNKQNTDGGASSSNPDPDKWYQYTHPDNGGTTANTNPIADQFSGWGLKNMFRRWLFDFLNVCFEAAALVIDTIRTFKLIVLAILGPLSFGLSVFDGFQHTIKQWLARYVNVYMWLPVANIFGAIISKIQENMIHINQAGGGGNTVVNDSNTAYLIFMLIGIIGYFTVPAIAGYIINVGGHALLSKTSSVASTATRSIASAGASGIGDTASGLSNFGKHFNEGYAGKDGGSGAAGAIGRAIGHSGAYMADKLSGKS